MLDISFPELAVIGAVALVVLGPERLPKVARTAGHLFGRLQRYVNTVKADISREMEASELSKLKQDVQDAARSFEQSIQQHANSLESEAKSLETEAKALQVDAENALATPPAATAPAATASPAAASDDGDPAAGIQDDRHRYRLPGLHPAEDRLAGRFPDRIALHPLPGLGIYRPRPVPA